MKAKVLRRMTSDDSDSNEMHSGNKENIDDTNKAAVVIQSRKSLLHVFILNKIFMETSRQLFCLVETATIDKMITQLTAKQNAMSSIVLL